MNPETKEEITPADPDAVNPPDEAANADPGEIAEARAAQKEEESEAPTSVTVGAFSKEESSSSSKKKKKSDTHYIAIELKYEDNGDPVKNEPFKVKLPDGSTKSGSTDKDGKARIEGIKKTGQCEVNFTRICKKEWKKA